MNPLSELKNMCQQAGPSDSIKMAKQDTETDRQSIREKERGRVMEAAAAEMQHWALKCGILLILQKLFEAWLVPYSVCP